jgi:hypothetical protein
MMTSAPGPLARLPLAALLVVAGAACAREATAPVVEAIAAGTFSDVSGDAPVTEFTETGADLVRGTATVADGSIAFSVRLAPGTFASATIILIGVDVDQNPNTGESDGIDYWINLGIGSPAVINKVTPDGPVHVGLVPASFRVDGGDTVVPLSLLGDDDGYLDIVVRAFHYRAPATFDVMPDSGRARIG